MNRPSAERSSAAPYRGRGAPSNREGRFERQRLVDLDALGVEVWWERDDGSGPRQVETVVTDERTRSAISTNDSPDVPFERSVNPYRGCEHGCAYCFARPSHAYLGLSAGLDFETRLTAKPDLPGRLRDAMAKPGYAAKPIAIGANTDPYQPIENERRLTRRVLELMSETSHPACVITKSARVLRDLDLLRDLARRRLVAVFVSVTTLDPALASVLEPRASAPHHRLRAVRALAEAGIRCGVLVSPIIPAVNDAEIERLVEAAAASGAHCASWALLRLPYELRELFVEWLDTHMPARREKVLGLLRSARGGDLYDARFGRRMAGEGPYARQLATRFRLARRRHGLADSFLDLESSRFRPPRTVARDGQRSLFD